MPRMIVDVHTHAFPPGMIERRSQLTEQAPVFAELYADPSARMATADELLASMASSGVDRAVVAGFWWDIDELAQEHASYLLEAAAASDGRLLPFVPLHLGPGTREVRLEAAIAGGARGLGEARLQTDPEGARWLSSDDRASRLPLLVHSSEQVGHIYPGKSGGSTPGDLWQLATARIGVVIAAHWGAGLPFFALMPEVHAALGEGRLLFDSAASPLLYRSEVFRRVIDLVGVELVMWGSDFPLRDQKADREAVEAALPDAAERTAVLGGNATRLLALKG